MNRLSSLVRNNISSVINQFVCFAGVGIIATFIHYVALVTLVKFSGVNPILASMIGFALSGLVNYF